MSKLMNLIKIAAKSDPLIRTHRINQGLTSLLRRRFSTEADGPIDPLPEAPSSGVVYGRLLGNIRHTMKSDVLNLLEGCKLRLDDIKVDYSRSYTPFAMLIRFPSRFAFGAAIRAIGRKGRLFRLEQVQNPNWDLITTFDGKAILLEGIPRNALIDDVERFLSGCQYDATSIQMFNKTTSQGDAAKATVVRFPSKAVTMHAFITKNGGYCMNNQVAVRVLQ